jgi:hypothetical protein
VHEYASKRRVNVAHRRWNGIYAMCSPRLARVSAADPDSWLLAAGCWLLAVSRSVPSTCNHAIMQCNRWRVVVVSGSGVVGNR